MALPVDAVAQAPSPEAVEKEELERIFSAHEAFLRGERTGARAALLSRYLRRINLSNRNLAKADFSGSSLCGAVLKFVNFSNANLYCCELLNVDARFANFEAADMRGVTLNGSNLARAKLDRADFRSGRLFKSGSGGREAVIDRNGSATGVDFSYCSLHGATFEGADLKGSNFTGAIISGTKFAGARMANVVLTNAIITDVNIAEMNLPPEAFKDCVLPPTTEAVAATKQLIFQLNAHRNWVESNARLGTCAVLDGVDLRPLSAVIGKFKLSAICARGVIAAGVDFSCTELQGANFEKADLRGASFEGADLRGVRFKGAQLGHAKFHGADLRPLSLKNGGVLATDASALSEEQRLDAIVA